MSATTDLNVPLSNEFLRPINREIGAVDSPEPGNGAVYLCGNSLGLLSNRSNQMVQEELKAWGTRAVVGHFSHPQDRPWVTCTDKVNPLMAELVGANEKEVACMGTLTNNLHLMMDSFYKPTAERYKIVCEAKAFPSDQYAFASQVKAHGFDPEEAIIEVSPRDGEYTLREEDILGVLEANASSIALVLFSGIQYYTGQYFPMKSITKKAKDLGCICGWDLAHAFGNVPLSLHDWDVDFAVWCTYKYGNSGPGGIAGLFIHERWHKVEKPKYAGWWGHELATRFKMPPKFSPTPGAQGFQQSNPCVLAVASLYGSLQIFKEVGGTSVLRERSLLLTGHLDQLLRASKYFVPPGEAITASKRSSPGFTIITPSDPEARGAQLSLLFLPVGGGIMVKVFDYLIKHGVVGDEREPDVIRLAPAPLYNTIADCDAAVRYLNEALDTLSK
ncbi:kynureninase [Coprinopsis cinerea okayama7|uniref:Kynureninase n=1 Tax=Coprinopsis cinerea (strain Okayama-7 / 130 / ATCC MYA-4618 / FGSC 9003) TaxID=240176 RepID=A8NFR6_COPC7|nr:kynureninase [Coprinopsis cinerea okayama7\|eukprot:XP_001833351.2 kynureninase [Coprinopsis cinerea okayama7\